MEKARAKAIISGRVQGVFFRASTQDAARGIGVSGWVRNLPNGKVEALFEGEREKVDLVIDWCRKGPEFSRVDNVDISFEAFKGDIHGFEIIY